MGCSSLSVRLDPGRSNANLPSLPAELPDRCGARVVAVAACADVGADAQAFEDRHGRVPEWMPGAVKKDR